MPPYYFEYDATDGIIAVRFGPLVTDEIFVEFYGSAPRYIASRTVRAGIVDFTEVTHFDVSAPTIRRIAALAPLLRDGTPRFIVAPRTHIYGMARMFQLVSGGTREHLHVVHQLAHAYAQIGVEQPHFEPMD